MTALSDRKTVGAGHGHVTLTRLIAMGACFAVAGRFTIQQGLTLGIVVGLALSPVWLPALWRMRGGRLILLLGILTPLSGWVLTEFHRVNHATNDTLFSLNSFYVIGLVTGIGVVVWARSIVGDATTALSFGLGLLAAIGTHGLDAGNPWKFDLSIPVTITVLAACMLVRRPWMEVTALAALALVSALNDSRSAGSLLLVTASVVIWQTSASRLAGRSSTVRTLVVFAIIGIVGYSSLQAFILDGWFGQAAAARSVAQIEQSGSLIVGGRPEIGASIALLTAQPMGFGSGTIPNVADVLIAKTGMTRLNYAPNNGYVENYMFGGGFEVHSLLGDFWLRFGIIGAAFLVTLLVAVALGVARGVSRRTASGLVVFLAIQALWDALFAPFFYTSISTLLIAVGLTLVARGDGGRAHRPRADDFVTFRTSD